VKLVELVKLKQGESIVAQDLEGDKHYGTFDSIYVGMSRSGDHQLLTFPVEAVDKNGRCEAKTVLKDGWHYCEEFPAGHKGLHRERKMLVPARIYQTIEWDNSQNAT
jgi:hypothetical protein